MNVFEQITSIDFSILMFIYENIRSDFLNAVMPVLSHIGEYGLIWLTISIVCLFSKKTRGCGVAMLVSVVVSFLLGEVVIKNVVCRVRPCNYPEYGFIDMLVSKLKGYSFPSGHTSSSFAASTVLFFYNKKWGTAALALALLIGFSRLYNFVHFPTDVLCGMLFGILCAVIVCVVFRKYKVNDRLAGIKE